jgi:hypothetical protein
MVKPNAENFFLVLRVGVFQSLLQSTYESETFFTFIFSL